jgi:hypothetical protein
MAAGTLIAIEAGAEPIVSAALNGFDVLESEEAVCEKVRRTRSL